jgi:hypothetical protein
MNTHDKTKDKDEISRECIFETIATEAVGLYNLQITVSTGVFGATLLFLERIAPSPTEASLLCLAFGWLILILCTGACVCIRWMNLESGRMALEGKSEEAQEIDKPNRRLTKFAIFALLSGIVLMVIFGFLNMVDTSYGNERTCKMCEPERKAHEHQSKKDITEHAIPYGSIDTPKDDGPPSEGAETQGNAGQTSEPSEDK